MGKREKIMSIVMLLAIISPIGMFVFAADGEDEDKDHMVTLEAKEADRSNIDQATHTEIDPIGLSEKDKFENLSTFCVTKDDLILACDSGKKQIRVIDQAGKTKATWKPGFEPYAIHCGKDGVIYVGGRGVVAKLDKKGKILKQIDTADVGFTKAKVSGIDANEKDVFVCFGSGWSLRSLSSVVRMDRDLGNAKTIAKSMRGCCQRLDIVSKEGNLYVAENARHRVVELDREGKQVGKWGERGREGLEGFGSCCNPMNLFFNSKGDLYTAESGLGRIKKYSDDGKLQSLVGYVGVERFARAGRVAASCSNITVATNKDESLVYVLDYSNSLIRVLKITDKAKAQAEKEEK